MFGKPFAATIVLALLPGCALASGSLQLRLEPGQRALLPADAPVLFEHDYGPYVLLSLPADEAGRRAVAGLESALVAEAGFISVGQQRFDPLLGPPAGMARLDDDGTGLYLIQYHGPLRSAWLAELHELGVEVLQYYPAATLLVHASGAALASAARSGAVRWIGPLLDSMKQDQSLNARSGTIENVSVLFHGLGEVDAFAARLEREGFKLLGLHPAQPDRRLWEAILVADAAALARLAAQPEVLHYAYASPRGMLEDEMASQILAGNYSAAGVPFPGYPDWLASAAVGGLSGEGVIWAVTDSGVDLSHPDFQGRIAGGFTYPGCPAGNGPGDDPSSGGHGTHVAGIVAGPAGSGLRDPGGFLWGLGVAPGARIFAQNPICAGGVPWPPAGGWQVLSRNAVLGGAVGTNNSWTSGEGTNAGYTAGARTHDIMVRNANFDTPELEPFHIVFSAGNSGPNPGTLTAPKEAKNAVIVGNSLNQRAGSITALASSSSRGPTRDGRIAPTVVAPGSQIASTRRVAGASQCANAIAGTSNLYAFCTGTSMAAPQVSGALALLIEQWRIQRGSDPSPAMGRALLANSALDITAAPIPDNNQGWGRVFLPELLGLGMQREVFDQQILLEDTGQSWSIAVGVPDPDRPLKVTLAWTDPPGPLGHGPTLVNDLDLRVETDNGSYLGNVFSGGVSVTGGSADRRNNLENVFVTNPGLSATIHVTASSLGGDALLGSPPQLRQDFALVCSNCALQPDFTLAVQPTSMTLCAPAGGEATVAVGQILGFDEPVALAVDGVPAGLDAVFGSTPLVPPASTALLLSGTASTAPGSYLLEVSGTASTGSKTRPLALNVFDGAPAATSVLVPEPGASYVSTTPTLSWQGVDFVQGYRVQVATDAAFTNLVVDQGVDGTSLVLGAPLAFGTLYYWRVQAANACGAAPFSVVASFQTAPEPGSCLPGDETLVHFSDDFDGPDPGWVVETAAGSAQWTLSTTNPRSAPHSRFAPAPATVTDQRLTSPTIDLPASGAPVLVFHHWRNLEENGAAACYDGGVLEVSVAGGPFTQVPPSQILLDPYNGPVAGNFGNPLAGLPAWCNVAEQYRRVVVDLGPQAGQPVRLRFRLGTDSSVGRNGWHIDDLRVQSCGGPRPDAIFADGFEVGDAR